MSQWGGVVGGETCSMVAARLQEVEKRWWSHCVGGGGARALGLSSLGWRGHCLAERLLLTRLSSSCLWSPPGHCLSVYHLLLA